jgi:hypothetical protein
MPAGVGALFITQLFLSFIVNLFLGYLFVYRGLLYAMAFKVFFGMRYIIAWVETDNPRDMFESLLTIPAFFS